MHRNMLRWAYLLLFPIHRVYSERQKIGPSSLVVATLFSKYPLLSPVVYLCIKYEHTIQKLFQVLHTLSSSFEIMCWNQILLQAITLPWRGTIRPTYKKFTAIFFGCICKFIMMHTTTATSYCNSWCIQYQTCTKKEHHKKWEDNPLSPIWKHFEIHLENRSVISGSFKDKRSLKNFL